MLTKDLRRVYAGTLGPPGPVLCRRSSAFGSNGTQHTAGRNTRLPAAVGEKRPHQISQRRIEGATGRRERPCGWTRGGQLQLGRPRRDAGFVGACFGVRQQTLYTCFLQVLQGRLKPSRGAAAHQRLAASHQRRPSRQATARRIRRCHLHDDVPGDPRRPWRGAARGRDHDHRDCPCPLERQGSLASWRWLSHHACACSSGMVAGSAVGGWLGGSACAQGVTLLVRPNSHPRPAPGKQFSALLRCAWRWLNPCALSAF